MIRTFTTRKAAVRALKPGEVAVDGKGTPARTWATMPAWVAEDLLSDDLGRDHARALLASGRLAFAIADYLARGHTAEWP
ncbi:MAG: hypothetical protein FJ191_13700 [Gammaproteobacteria bacterium]|nr:hypothetical protein [Gammaproteobacteria bacterium]